MITNDDVVKIGKLANLQIEAEEAVDLTRDLNAILEYVNKLNKLDVSRIEPMSHVHGSVNVLREDQSTPSMDSKEGLKNAPDRNGRFIRVPIIMT